VFGAHHSNSIVFQVEEAFQYSLLLSLTSVIICLAKYSTFKHAFTYGQTALNQEK
jgi:hypothetical protein